MAGYSFRSVYPAGGRHERLVASSSLVTATVGSVLDLGAGDGALAKVLDEQSCGPYLSIDRDHSLNVAIVADASAIPARSGSISCVVANEILEHLQDDVFESAVAEIARVSLDRIVVSVPNAEQLELDSFWCPSCRSVSNEHGHVRSIGLSDLTESALFDGYGAAEVLVVGPPRVQSHRWARYMRVALHYNPRSSVCSVCGTGAPKSRGVVRYLGRLISLAGRVKSGRPEVEGRWLVAMYVRCTEGVASGGPKSTLGSGRR